VSSILTGRSPSENRVFIGKNGLNRVHFWLTHSNRYFSKIHRFDLKSGNQWATMRPMRTSKPRPYRDEKRPHLKFVVNFKRNGKRARSFFESKKVAQTFAQLKNNERAIGDTEGAKQLAAFGKTIADAIEFYLPHLKASNRTCTFAELVAELLPAKAADGASAVYLKTLKCRLGQFANSFGEKLVSEIQVHEIDEWLRGLKVSPVSRNNSRRVLRTAFSFAVKRNYCVDNTAAKTAKAKEIEGTVGILSVPDTARLLEAADTELVPFIAIGAFAGLRRAELERLDWSDVDLEQSLIEVKAVKAKSARRRLVKILPNLAKWLAPYVAHRGMVAPGHIRGQFEATRAAAGITEWPSNALRHSFASYHLAHFNNAAALALELGHTSSNLVFQHYRQLVKPKDAEKYWNLVPTAGGAKKVVAFAAQ
jgi:integrase